MISTTQLASNAKLFPEASKRRTSYYSAPTAPRTCSGLCALQLVGQTGDLFDGCREVFGALRLLPGRSRRSVCGTAGLFARGRNLLRAGKYLTHRPDNSIRGGEQLIGPSPSEASSELYGSQTFHDRLVFSNLRSRGGRDHLQITSHRRDLYLNGHRHILCAPGVIGRLARQVANIRRHHSKATTEFSCARSFHRTAYRQHVCLHSDQRDAIDDLLDTPAGRLQCR